jgi:hypothetical protein
MLLVAFSAVYRSAFGGFEGNFRLYSAVRAGNRIHLPLSAFTKTQYLSPLSRFFGAILARKTRVKTSYVITPSLPED